MHSQIKLLRASIRNNSSTHTNIGIKGLHIPHPTCGLYWIGYVVVIKIAFSKSRKDKFIKTQTIMLYNKRELNEFFLF